MRATTIAALIVMTSAACDDAAPPSLSGPAAPTAVTTTTVTSSSTTAPAITLAPVTTTAPAASTAPASSPYDGLAARPVEIVTTGATGTWSYGPGGAGKRLAEDLVVAIGLPDQHILGQRSSSPDVLIFDPNDRTTSPQVLDLDVGPNETVRVHDVNVVDGRTLLLYDTRPPVDSPDVVATLRVHDLGSGADTDIAEHGLWETDVRRLHLASNGWIVGEQFGLITGWLVAYSIGTTPPPAAIDLGLESFYDEDACGDDCPASFTVSRDGTMLAWTEGDSMVVVSAAEPDRREVVALGASLDGRRVDIDLSGTSAAITRIDRPLGEALPPLHWSRGMNEPVEMIGAVATISPITPAVADAAGRIGTPTFDADGCGPVETARFEGARGLYIHPGAGPHPVQLFADPNRGIAGPYVIVERFFEGQRYSVDTEFGQDLAVNGRPAQAFIAGDGQGEVSWVLLDGSEVYLRGRGFDRGQLLAVATGLQARSTDDPIAGFDLAAPPGSGLALIDESADLRGSAVTAWCTLSDGAQVSAAVLSGPPVFQYAVALDTAPAADVAELANGQLISVIGPPAARRQALASLREGP